MYAIRCGVATVGTSGATGPPSRAVRGDTTPKRAQRLPPRNGMQPIRKHWNLLSSIRMCYVYLPLPFDLLTPTFSSSAGARATSRHPSTTDEQVMHAGSLLLGLYILRDISMSRPTTPSNAAAGSTSFPFVPPPIHPRTPDRGKEGPPLEPLTPHQRHLPPLARNAELAARDEAEMRGEDYINTMLAQRMQDPFDDIGTVDDDLDGVEEPAVDDAQEGPAAPEPHQVAAAPTPLPPTPQILHPEGPIGDDFRAVNGEESPHATIAFDECHPALLLLYILVTWLHTQFKLPFRACGAVLSVVYHILLLAGVEPRIPEQGWSTLPTYYPQPSRHRAQLPHHTTLSDLQDPPPPYTQSQSDVLTVLRTTLCGSTTHGIPYSTQQQHYHAFTSTSTNAPQVD